MEQYENYKDSGIEYIGKIPEHWEVKKLKFCFNFATGFTPSTGNSEYYIDGDNIWITIADMQDKIIKDSNQKITDFAIEQNKAQIIPKGALLYSFKLSVGKVAFTGIDCYTNEAIFSVLPSNDVNLGFYYYSLPEQVIKNANENIYGAKLLNQDLIKNAIIVVPKAYEQVAIADFLDRKTAEIDKIIANKQKLIALYEEEKQAIINQAVTKGLDPNVKMKDSGVEWLGEIPEHWEVKKLKYVVCKIGSGITPKGGSEVYQTSGIPLLRSQNIYFDELKLEDVAFISSEIDATMSNSRIKDKDILLNITGGSIGRCFYVPIGFGNGNVNQHVCIIRPIQEKIYFLYLYLIFRSNLGQLQIDLQQTGANREGLNFEQLKNFIFPILELNEQQSIVYFIEHECSKLDAIIEKFNKQIELLQEYRTTLISEVVTGKVKVK